VPSAPLAPNQRALWLADRAASRPATYTVAALWAVRPAPDPAVLAARLEAAVARHPVLAARVVEEAGTLVSTEGERPALEILPAASGPEEALAAASARCSTPFAVEAGPLLRIALCPHGGAEAYLALAAHHLVLDELSVDLLAGWLLGESIPPAAPPFAAWVEEATRRAAAAAARVDAIRRELASCDLSPPLDWGLGDGTADASAGCRVPFEVDARIWGRVRDQARAAGISPFSILLSAIGLVYGRRAGVDRPVLTTTVSRRGARYAASLGYFNCAALVPVELDDAADALGSIHAVHDRAMQAYADSLVPLDEVLDGLVEGRAPPL
jgi:hypothetical protein